MSFDVRFKTPCNILLTGPTQSGKSTFINKTLRWRHLLFDPIPKTVFFVYAGKLPMADNMLKKGLIHKAIKGLPKSYDALEGMISPYADDGVLVIVDDGLSQLESYLPTVFEELTHRMNTTFLFVSQTTFLASTLYRRLSDQSHYIICLRNARNSLKIRHLATQVRPCNPSFIVKSYIDATNPKRLVKDAEKKDNTEKSSLGYGYCIFDFFNHTPEILRVRSNIFPNEKNPVTVYKEGAEN